MFNVNVSKIVSSLNPWDDSKSSNDNTNTGTNTNTATNNSIYDESSSGYDPNKNFDIPEDPGNLPDEQQIAQGRQIAHNFFEANGRTDLADRVEKANIAKAPLETIGPNMNNAVAAAYNLTSESEGITSSDSIFISNKVNFGSLRYASEIVHETVHLGELAASGNIGDSQDWEREALTAQKNFNLNPNVHLPDINVDEAINNSYSNLPVHPPTDGTKSPYIV